MGRAIEHENDIQELKKEVKQLKTAFSGLSATVETLQNTAPARKNIDLHKKDVKPKTDKKKKSTNKVVEEATA